MDSENELWKRFDLMEESYKKEVEKVSADAEKIMERFLKECSEGAQ